MEKSASWDVPVCPAQGVVPTPARLALRVCRAHLPNPSLEQVPRQDFRALAQTRGELGKTGFESQSGGTPSSIGGAHVECGTVLALQADSPGRTPESTPPRPLAPALRPRLLPGPSPCPVFFDTETSADLNVGGWAPSQCQQQLLGRTKSHPHPINKMIRADPRAAPGRG